MFILRCAANKMKKLCVIALLLMNYGRNKDKWMCKTPELSNLPIEPMGAQ